MQRLGGGTLALAIAGCGSKPSPPALRRFDVRDFGAKGDGATNDTRAFQRAAGALNAAGGGRLVIAPGTYVVGLQRQAERGTRSPLAFSAEPILRIHGCRGRVEIDGRGATLKAANGLRLGAFEPFTDRPYEPPGLPFLNFAYKAEAYAGMLALSENADVVRGLELDGNLQGLALGGLWGDTGRQCFATGILAEGNRRLLIRDVETHHHGLDGITIANKGLTAGAPPRPHRLQNVHAHHNARQGLSLLGGVGFRASACRFSDTGQARFMSGPGAGVDIEAAAGSVVRDALFDRCEFVNNAGAGLIADTGDSAGVAVRNSLLWGSRRGPAVWPDKPGFAFERCRIFGWVVNAHGSPRPELATRFAGCRFEDRAHSVNGRPLTGQALIELRGENVLFDECSVDVSATRSFSLGDPATAERIRGCTVTHRADGLPAGDYQALLRGVSVEQTTFEGHFASPPDRAYYIAHASTRVGAGVQVTGRDLTWGPDGIRGSVPSS